MHNIKTSKRVDIVGEQLPLHLFARPCKPSASWGEGSNSMAATRPCYRQFRAVADVSAGVAVLAAPAEVQNELARLGVDVLNTQGHNERLEQALDMLDTELKDKVCDCVSGGGAGVPQAVQ